MDHDPPSADDDPDRPSPLGRKALVLLPVVTAAGIVVVLLGMPGWVIVAALVLFLIWLLIDG